jgi:hypothetical protein
MTAFQRHNKRAAKLTGEQVNEIRERYAFERVTQAQLCREYGVSLNTIGNIVNGVTWQGLEQPPRRRLGHRYIVEPSESDAQASMERLKAQLAAMPEGPSLYDDPPPTQDEDSRAGRGLEKLNKLLDEKAEVGRQLDDLTKGD